MSLDPKTPQQPDKAWETLREKFPDAKAIDFKTDYSKTVRLQVSKAGYGKNNIFYSPRIKQLWKNKSTQTYLKNKRKVSVDLLK